LNLELEGLFAGRQPSKKVIDAARKLNWWRHLRSYEAVALPWSSPSPECEFFNTPSFYLIGITGIYPPRPMCRAECTGELVWMDPEFRWCRCLDGWWRLGEYDAEIGGDIPVTVVR
jgi:hypothetical protein